MFFLLLFSDKNMCIYLILILIDECKELKKFKQKMKIKRDNELKIIREERDREMKDVEMFFNKYQLNLNKENMVKFFY